MGGLANGQTTATSLVVPYSPKPSRRGSVRHLDGQPDLLVRFGVGDADLYQADSVEKLVLAGRREWRFST
jgi:hypothetical protein